MLDEEVKVLDEGWRQGYRERTSFISRRRTKQRFMITEMQRLIAIDMPSEKRTSARISPCAYFSLSSPRYSTNS